MKGLAYRCFLPDLTGIHKFPLRRTQLSSSLAWGSLTHTYLNKAFNPAIADCRLQGTATSPSSTTHLFNLIWQRERDLNPRDLTVLHAFQACPLANSDISPYFLNLLKKSLMMSLHSFSRIPYSTSII